MKTTIKIKQTNRIRSPPWKIYFWVKKIVGILHRKVPTQLEILIICVAVVIEYLNSPRSFISLKSKVENTRIPVIPEAWSIQAIATPFQVLLLYLVEQMASEVLISTLSVPRHPFKRSYTSSCCSFVSFMYIFLISTQASSTLSAKINSFNDGFLTKTPIKKSPNS